jgi:hypothetical protein
MLSVFLLLGEFKDSAANDDTLFAVLALCEMICQPQEGTLSIPTVTQKSNKSTLPTTLDSTKGKSITLLW